MEISGKPSQGRRIAYARAAVAGGRAGRGMGKERVEEKVTQGEAQRSLATD